MRVREVRHVDVVAQAGAVGRGVVGAEYGERVAAVQGGVDHERDQVRLGVMVLAEAAGRVRAGGIEVAQAGGAQPVHLARPVQRPLDHQLALAIGRAGAMAASSSIGTRFGSPNRLAVEESTKRSTPWRTQASIRVKPPPPFSCR